MFFAKKEALLPFFVFLILIISLLLTSYTPFTYYDHKRWVVLTATSLFSCVFAAINLSKKKQFSIELKEHNLLLIVLGVYIFYRGVIGLNSNHLLDALSWISLFLFGYSFSQCYSQKSEAILLKLIVIAFFFYYVLVLMQTVFVFITPIVWNIQVLAVGFDNVRFFNQVQVVVFPIALYLCHNYSPRIKFVSVLVATLTVAFALYSQGLGVRLTLILQSILLFVLLVKRDRCVWRYIFIFGFIWFSGYIFYNVFWLELPTQLFGLGKQGPLSSGEGVRITMLLESLVLWLKHPIFGTGGMSYSNPENGFSYIFAHPHNSVIQILMEYGIVGLVLTSSYIIMLLSVITRNYRQFVLYESGIYLLVAFLGAMLLSLVSGVVVMPLSQFLVLILILLLNCQTVDYHKAVDRVRVRKTINLSVLFYFLVASIVGFFLLFFAFHSYVEIMNQEVLVMDKGPRFWLVGRYL